MIIRDAGAGDAAAIADIWNREIREGIATFTDRPKTRPEIRALIARRAAEGDVFVVAEAEGGAIVGFCTTGPFRHGPGYAHSREHSIHLAPPAQRAGTGRALMQAMEQRARAGAVHVLIAGIAGSNAPAIAFHKALGFHEAGRLREVGVKFGKWHDLVLMLKILHPPDSADKTL